MADASVLNCGHCGQPNWIPANWNSRTLGCTHCGGALDGSGARRSGGVLFKWAGAFCAVAAVWIIGAKYVGPSAPPAPSYSYTPPSSTPARPAPVPVAPKYVPPAYTPPAPDFRPTAAPKPVPVTPFVPPGVPIAEGLVRETKGKNKVVPLGVRGAPNNDYFVKIVGATKGEEIAALFVRGGNTINVTMPLGTYQMRFASGRTWYGEASRFGPTTQYWVADQKLVFRRENNRPQAVSITLAPERGGSLKLRPTEGPKF